MQRLLAALLALGVGSTLFTATAAERAPMGTEADELVSLLKLHEREAQAIRFMIAVFPMEMPPGLADCTVREAIPAVRSYFASQFSDNLSKFEMQQAIEFFQSQAGQAVVDLRLEHEQGLLDAAARKEQVSDEELHYPGPLQKELESFGLTSAGKYFVEDELLARETVKARASELRSAAMARCLAASE